MESKTEGSTSQEELERPPQLAESRSARFSDCAMVFVLALIGSCWLLGAGPLAGTEGHRALAAHDMVTSGRWLIPHLYDQVYLRKPPLQYWIAGGLEKITGVAQPLIWRLPSALSGSLTAAFLYWIGARWYGRLAGLVSGISFCGMLALWSQNRTAEIDALNTLACVACACFILDLGWGPARNKLGMMLGAAAAFAIAMLTKGPAGIAPILGALLGPAMINRTMRAMKSPMPYIGLVLGLAPFCVYGLLVLSEFKAQTTSPDTNGLQEAYKNILANRIANIPDGLELPFKLFGFSQPTALVCLFAFLPSLWRKSENARWPENDRLMLRGLVGTIVAAFVITEILGLVHARYSYVWLPMLCPIAGAIAAAWSRGVMPGDIGKRRTMEAAGYSAILFAGGGVVLAFLCFHFRSPYWRLAVACGVLAIPAAVFTLVSLKKYRWQKVGWGFILIILFASMAFAPYGVLDRERRSTQTASAELMKRFPSGHVLTTGDLIFEQPEIFYYADMKTESYPYQFAEPMQLPTSRWLVLKDEEWAEWHKGIPGQLKDVQNIDGDGVPVWLVWFEAKAEGK